MGDTNERRQSGTVTVLGLVAAGAFPMVAFAAWLLTTAGTTTPLAKGGSIPNIFAPASGQAKTIVDLAMFVLGVTGAIFLVVFSLLVWAIVKFRRTEANADREPAQVYGSNQIELAWTILPCLIVV